MKRALVLPFAALLLAVVSLARDARAGTLQIRDDAHVLSAADAARLRSVVDGAGFDARLVFTDEFGDAQSLSRFVGSLVSEPDMVAVGIEPSHRHVEVHFGTGSGVARSEWPAIERAGNAAFRDGKWEAGAAAIFRAASTASTAAPGTGPLPHAGRSPSFIGSGLFLLLLIAGVIVAVAFVARRRSPYESGGYGPGPGAGPYGGYGPSGGPYGGYGPSGGPGGVGPLGGGLIGAGLGGLAGYELGKIEGEREEGERGAEPRESGGRPGDDFDAGGGGSSWDGGADDSGGDGGGFDGGDGGGDSGGGSDF